ncbi:asparaginase [Nocardioides sp. NPDC057772]|uniref:asparaginase n=1 Tax=Nocardioides sp. NPDC057772 TaxID=3346245 RepID=UPI003671C06C
MSLPHLVTPVADPAPMRAPVHEPLVELWRGEMVEGVHHGSAVLLDPEGRARLAIGDIEAAFYPRSAAKPMQAVAMVRAGLDVDDDLLALAAASHSGETVHLAGARRLLASAGLGEEALKNPPDLPYDPVERESWLRADGQRSRLAHNCSGKHAAMVATCVTAGWAPGRYLDPAHPLQEAIRATVEELTGQRVATVTADGCGTPLFGISLHGLARAARRLVLAPGGSAEHRVAAAMRRHPEMVAGTRRDVTTLMRKVPGLLAKDGFEAVQVAALPDGTSLALKVADGADRARLPALLALLAEGGVDPAALAPLAPADLRPATTLAPTRTDPTEKP